MKQIYIVTCKDNTDKGNKHYITSNGKRIIALEPYKRTIHGKEKRRKYKLSHQ